MTRRTAIGIPVVLLVAATVLTLQHSPRREGIRAPASAAGIRLPFVANEGQADRRVAFTARTFGGPLFVTRDGAIVYNLPERSATGPGWTGSGVSLVERPAGASGLAPEGRDRVATRVNEFVGRDPSLWRRDVKAYGAVSVGEPWPGIDLSVVARGNNVEKLFTVGPGADPSAIRMTMEGAKRLSVDGQGRLAAETEKGTVRFTRPAAWQEDRGRRRPVAVEYRLAGNGYGFELGGYDRSREVVIDPLLAATYLGGNSANTNDGSDDQPWAIACDASGNLYVAGATGSTDFPSKAGGYDNSYGTGGSRAFIVKLSPDLETLQAATFYGGSGSDTGTSMALRGGSVYLAGHTGSDDLPVTAGCYDNTRNGGLNAFVAKFSADLSTLQAATYLGNGQEQWPKMAIDPSGNVVLAGEEYAGGFPMTDNAYQTAFRTSSGWGGEFFVAKLSGDLSTLLASTYLGGAPAWPGYGYDYLPSVAVDNQGRIYVGGFTEGTGFPTTPGAYDENGGEGYHIARMDPGLTTVQAATYLAPGAAGVPASLQMAFDASGRLFVAAWNHSSYGDFPTTPGAFMPARLDNTAWEIGVARLDPDLTTVQKGTYLGGSAGDFATTVVPANGSVYLAGQTESTDFPMGAESYDNTLPTRYGVFVARFDDNLSTLLGATFLPGSSQFGNNPRALVAVDPSGNAFVSWITSSPAVPTTDNAFQPSFHNVAYSFDGAIAKFDANLTGGTVPSDNTTDPPADNTATLVQGGGGSGCQSAPGEGNGDLLSFLATVALLLPATRLARSKA